ncbi:MAG: serine/threonine protein kinase, partial [Planctomycetaceae bacterium]|nr:serine/threonine protein kinase [Planctomycetaceae bacterium]
AAPSQSDQSLLDKSATIVDQQRLSWTTYHHLTKLLGSGGQGKVYLSQRKGADGFTLPIAIKIFSPERFADESSYAHTMKRHARVAMQIAQIQHDNLLDVQDFVDRKRIRMLVMEWIDGLDLRILLNNQQLAKLEDRVSSSRWKHINHVIITDGPKQPQFHPGCAVAIARECLSALEALHRNGIVHGDIKPGNIMIKRTGAAKIIDIGSAFAIDEPPEQRTCTPAYAAPEVLKGEKATPLSDLASLGYVLIELISGRNPFAGKKTYNEMIQAKIDLPQQLKGFIPTGIGNTALLTNFCRRLIAADPGERFHDAYEAHLKQEGAADYHRQLVLESEDNEYEHEIGQWIEETMDAHNEV